MNLIPPPGVSDKASVIAGTPLAIVGVMVWRKVFKEDLDQVTAVAFGAVFASIIGYLWQVFTFLVDRWLKNGDRNAFDYSKLDDISGKSQPERVRSGEDRSRSAGGEGNQ